MKPTTYSFYLLICLLAGAGLLLAQPTTLSGVLALDATRVTAIDAAGGTLTVDDPSLFATGDRVLVIQMQGAGIDPSNSSSFGSITSLNGAGSYEINVVCDTRISNSEVVMENVISSDFASTGVATAGVQLIRIPQYVDVDVTGPLTAPAWNGTTGGVLIFEASGTVTLNADIDMSGRGFRGGDYIDMDVTDTGPFSILCLLGFDDYGYSLGDQDGAQKGEGIADYIPGQEYGRGTQANGGGGGNEHDAGGGGGGNYGAGGIGSQRVAGSCNGTSPGEGGRSLSAFGYLNGANGIFMGGGGGAGHSNNEGPFDPDFPGGNGGGIIFIIADQIIGNGNQIRSNGEGFSLVGGAAANDGGSGGGAGGSIVVSANSITAGLDLVANGGKGTDVNGSSGSNCAGPGGGGGGGVVWTNTTFAGITTSVAGGIAGVDNNGACGAATSAIGAAGGILSAFTPNLATVSAPGCVLPVELLGFEGQLRHEAVELRWTSLVETNHHYYRIERRVAAQPWQTLDRVYGQGESSQPLDYQYRDVLPQPGANQYRLAYVSLDGQVSYSRAIEVYYQPSQYLRVLEQHQAGDRLVGRIHLPQRQPWRLDLRSLSGQSLLQREFQPAQAGPQSFGLALPQLPAGVYLLSVQQGGQRHTQRVIWR